MIHFLYNTDACHHIKKSVQICVSSFLLNMLCPLLCIRRLQFEHIPLIQLLCLRELLDLQWSIAFDNSICESLFFIFFPVFLSFYTCSSANYGLPVLITRMGMIGLLFAIHRRPNT